MYIESIIGSYDDRVHDRYYIDEPLEYSVISFIPNMCECDECTSRIGWVTAVMIHPLKGLGDVGRGSHRYGHNKTDHH